MAKLTDDAPAILPDLVTVNTKFLVPEFPSVKETLLIETMDSPSESVVVVLLVRIIVALLKSKIESESVTTVTFPDEKRYFNNSKKDENGPSEPSTWAKDCAGIKTVPEINTRPSKIPFSWFTSKEFQN